MEVSLISRFACRVKRIIAPKLPAFESQVSLGIRLNRAVICHISGGLANQMICYKLGRFISATYHRTLVFDVTQYSGDDSSNRNLQLTEFNISYDFMVWSPGTLQQILHTHDVTRLVGEVYQDFADELTKKLAAQRLADAGSVVFVDIFTALTLREKADDTASGQDMSIVK